MWDTPLHHFVPNQGGALWIGILVTAALLADFRKLASPRNLVVLGLLAIAPALLEVIHIKGARAAHTFEYIFLFTAVNTAWALRVGLRGCATDLKPNLPREGLRLLALALVVCNVVTLLGRFPDDAGYYTNLGAQRWRETGVLPYADAKLKGAKAPGYGASATYGPMLLASHLPAQALLGTPDNPPEADPMDKEHYVRPPVLATQLTCLGFHLIGLFSLLLAAKRLAGEDAAWAAVALYAGSPYVIGLGGQRELIGGVVYISHIAPVSATLLAFLLRGRPFVSGALLAFAAGTLYYPAFLFPLWVGWQWRGEGGSLRAALRFAGGFAVCAIAIAALVFHHTPPTGDKGALAQFLESTLEHQEGSQSREYGSSHLSFWGTHPGLARIFHSPLFGSGSLFKGTFLAFTALSAGAFFLVRGRPAAQLAALTAMIAAAVQLWKTHAAGSYVEWYLPVLLIGLFGTCPKSPAGDGGGAGLGGRPAAAAG